MPKPKAPPPSARRTVEELIAAYKPRRRLDLGALPETKEINQLVDAGVSTRVISEWLKGDCGYKSRISLEGVKAYAANRRGPDR